MPVLLMHSDNSVYGNEWTPAFNKGDAVLDVEDISLYGRELGPYVTEKVIKGGMHDLFLSEASVREKAYVAMFEWLAETLE